MGSGDAMAGAVLAVVFGAVLAPLFVVGFVRNIIALVRVTWSRSAARAVGTVVGVVGKRLQYRTVDRLVIEFTTDDGRRIEFTDPLAQRATLRRGDRVVVRYRPDRPQHTATIADTARAVVVAAMAGVLTFMVVGMLVVGVLIVAGVMPVASDW